MLDYFSCQGGPVVSERANLSPFLLFRGLYEVLREKYEWSEQDAMEFSAFLLPMLDFNTERRSTALQSLQHPWLKDAIWGELSRLVILQVFHFPSKLKAIARFHWALLSVFFHKPSRQDPYHCLGLQEMALQWIQLAGSYMRCPLYKEQNFAA